MAFSNRLASLAVLGILIIGHSKMLTAKDVTAHAETTLVVRIDNLAAVPADDVQFAQNRAAAIFERIGVRLRWMNQEDVIREGVRPPFTVVFVSGEKNAGRASLFVDALGLADPTVRRAHVFHDRVAALNVGTPRTIPSLLGDVIAHELGHLLLPPPGHSVDGIMRPELETRLWALRTFTPSQAREILSRIRQLR